MYLNAEPLELRSSAERILTVVEASVLVSFMYLGSIKCHELIASK